MSTHNTSRSTRPYAVAFIIGAAFQAAAALFAQAFVQPDAKVSDEMWSYPWTADELYLLTLLNTVSGALMLAGLVAFARSGLVGASRAGRIGSWINVASMAVFTAAQFLQTTVVDQRVDDTGPQILGATFGLAVVLLAVGMFMVGLAMLRAGTWDGWRRYVPMANAISFFLLLGIVPTNATMIGIAIFGLMLVAFAVAFYTRPVPTESADRGTSPVRLH
jgi:hypothetical protein